MNINKVFENQSDFKTKKESNDNDKSSSYDELDNSQVKANKKTYKTTNLYMFLWKVCIFKYSN